MSYVEWSALGILLILLELFAPGVYLIWFGFAGLVMAGLTFFNTELTLTVQLLSFSLISVVMVCIGFYVYALYLKKDGQTNHPFLNDRSAQLVGKTVKVTADVQNGQTKVAVGDTVWLAQTDENFKAGDEALVIGVQKGVILLLGKKE